MIMEYQPTCLITNDRLLPSSHCATVLRSPCRSLQPADTSYYTGEISTRRSRGQAASEATATCAALAQMGREALDGGPVALAVRSKDPARVPLNLIN